MTRVEELTWQFADGATGEAEVAELAALIAADATARSACLELLELEAALRGDRAVDLVAVTMARLQTVLDDRVVPGVMERLPKLPAVVTAESPRVLRVNFSRTARRVAWAACFVIAAFGGWRLWPTPAARVAEAAGDVRVARGQKTFTAYAGFPLKTGDWLLTGSNGTAAVAFPGELTRVAVGTNAELGLVSTAPGKQLRFLAGTLRASVARQSASHPMLLRTPTARAEVLGTKFDLNVRASGTRLAVEEGRVLFATTNDESGVVIEASQAAVVMAGEPVTLEITPLAQRLNSGLLAHWTFDGTGRDVSGHGRDLFASANAAWGAGRIGQSLDLHAVTADVHSPRMKWPDTFTITLWARLDPAAPARPHPLLALDNQNGPRPEFSLTLQPTRAGYGLVFNVSGPGLGSQAFAEPSVLTPGRWQHLALVVDAAVGRATFYVNGRDVTATGALRPGFQLNGVLRLGRRVAGGPLPFDGQLDDLRIYARSLAPAEITALAQGEMTAK